MMGPSLRAFSATLMLLLCPTYVLADVCFGSWSDRTRFGPPQPVKKSRRRHQCDISEGCRVHWLRRLRGCTCQRRQRIVQCSICSRGSWKR
ncbi:hypothetical protein GY45DRAFT_1061938 [Cubamyces sp. BRFM 1775]|nr:hypothetical protein GY45DRAFT_1061938 [Cubamyces sp. BRFM 1775]